MKPLVTFGFVNCNRLYYLKSGVESLVYCTEDYSNKEIIIVDNASIEKNTDKYLKYCEDEYQAKIIKRDQRDPHNEFAKALNSIINESEGKYICAMAGDVQFVMKDVWLHSYVDFFEKYNDVGCILIDAQRRGRLNGYSYSDVVDNEFVYNYSRAPMTPVCHSFTSRENLLRIYPWNENCQSHEGGYSAEAEMVQRIKERIQDKVCVCPIYSPAITIYNEQGDNAKVRDNKIYGEYFEPKENFKYYEVFDYKYMLTQKVNQPIGIEDIATPIGWNAPMDENGNWNKQSLDLSIAPYKDIEDDSHCS